MLMMPPRRVPQPVHGGFCSRLTEVMVATVGRVTARGGPNGGHRYYLNSVANGRHDYYTGAGEAPGVWTGRGRGLLGLEGIVHPDDMDTLVAASSILAPPAANAQRAYSSPLHSRTSRSRCGRDAYP